MKTVAMLFAVLFLTACSGGGSSSGTKTFISDEVTSVQSEDGDSITIVKGAEE